MKGVVFILIGLLLSPALIGIPLVIWGLLEKEMVYFCRNCLKNF